MTSHDVVGKARRLLRIKQIGHAGTLDPAATGVLPLAVGSACRLLRFLPHDKTYVAGILLGQTTSTDDTQGEVLTTSGAVPAAISEIEPHLQVFRGPIQQVPPVVSAIHIDGERLYKLAREGRAPEEIPSRSVTIYSIEVLEYQAPLLSLRVHCSGGTYIRSIARDLGRMLGCGGCLASLRREQAGRFLLRDSINLNDMTAPEQVRLQRPEDVLTLPAVPVEEEAADRLKKGQRLCLPASVGNEQLQEHGDETTVTGPQQDTDEATELSQYVMALQNGELIAICKRELAILSPAVVLNR